jgi:hypothetical protein
MRLLIEIEVLHDVMIVQDKALGYAILVVLLAIYLDRLGIVITAHVVRIPLTRSGTLPTVIAIRPYCIVLV